MNQFPQIAEEGDPGQERELRLELKLIADVGIVGAPNAGKSSLITAVSAARPKIADYPFTTLEPVLGVVEHQAKTFVMVDIPGLIEGAHEGVGLGDDFLRHVERTRLLVHVIDGTLPDPVDEYYKIRREIELYNPAMADKPEIVVVNKRDIPEAKDGLDAVKQELAGTGLPVFFISAAAHMGLKELLDSVVTGLADLAAKTARAADAGEVETTDDAPIIRPRPVGDPGQMVRIVGKGRFVVNYRPAERFAAMLKSHEWAARMQFYEQLRRMKVIDALEKAGVMPGDTVVIGDTEMEWD